MQSSESRPAVAQSRETPASSVAAVPPSNRGRWGHKARGAVDQTTPLPLTGQSTCSICQSRAKISGHVDERKKRRGNALAWLSLGGRKINTYETLAGESQ